MCSPIEICIYEKRFGLLRERDKDLLTLKDIFITLEQGCGFQIIRIEVKGIFDQRGGVATAYGGRKLTVNEAKPMAPRGDGGGFGGRQRRESRW